jgi:flagellar biosynthetic protein FliP
MEFIINGESSDAVKIIIVLTLISLAPFLLLMMTCFTRIIIVLSFLRNALGLQQTPPNQVLIGLALFVTFFIMQPVLAQVNETALKPYNDGLIETEEFLDRASIPIKEFMLKQTTNEEVEMFKSLASDKAVVSMGAAELPLHIVVPAFITSELKRAFLIGFLLFIPFLIIDLIVSSTLMSMGMIMLPPVMISLPFKVMLFVVVDGRGLPRPFPHIVIGNEDFGELRPIVIPLLDVIDAGIGINLDTRRIIQIADKIAVIVGQQEFALNSQQSIPQADVIFFCKAVLTHVFVVALGFKVRRVTVEKADGAVVLPNQLLEILVFDHHFGKPSVSLFNQWKIGPHIMGLTAIAGKSRCVAVADKLVKPGCLLYIGSRTVTGEGIFNKVKVCAGVEDITQCFYQFIRLFPYTAVQVNQQSVEIVIYLKVVTGRLVKQYPAASAEYFNVSFVVEGKQCDDQLTQGFFAADP